MGAGLRMNLGPTWGPQVWRDTTSSAPNSVLVDVANDTAKVREKDRKRKSTEGEKERRRQSKYAHTDDSLQARKSYSRHDGGAEPDDVHEDVSPEYLNELKQQFYAANVIVSKEQACEIEQTTRGQTETLWREERRKRMTASKVGGVAKMRKGTKRAKRVEEMLYSRFTGSAATRYGLAMEEEAMKQYVAYQHQHGHPTLATKPAGLCISTVEPWLAASPDGMVTDPLTASSHGLVELKNPYSGRELTIQQFGSKQSSCLEMKNEKWMLKKGHDYHYQIQCQLYCADKDWCDFVVRTEKDMHVERIHRDREWWSIQLDKCKKFYFSSLLPELACPRHSKGGIREPSD